MRGALEFHAEARRLRDAFRRLTAAPSRATLGHAENPDIRNNVEHCRALLLRGIEEEPQRRVIEQLLRYMEKSVAESADIQASDRQDDDLRPRPPRLKDGSKSWLANFSEVKVCEPSRICVNSPISLIVPEISPLPSLGRSSPTQPSG